MDLPEFPWIKKCIACIGDLCHLNSFLLGTEHILKCSGSVVLSKETNVRLLHEAEDVSSLIDLNKHSEYVKQRSEQWKELQSQCFITGSTMYNALGFRGTQEMKLHFREFVLKQNDHIFDDQTLLQMQYGTDNEVNYFAILYRHLHGVFVNMQYSTANEIIPYAILHRQLH